MMTVTTLTGSKICWGQFPPVLKTSKIVKEAEKLWNPSVDAAAGKWK